MNKNYLTALQQLFAANANKANAVPMKKYMKSKFEFYGIKTPDRRALCKDFLKEYGMPDSMKQTIKRLWELPQRECQYFAMDLLENIVKTVEKEYIKLFEYLIINKSWWDTVDFIAAKLVGPLFQQHPELTQSYTEKWMISNNMWLKRTAILFQLKYKDKTDFKLLSKYILQCADAKEFFIQKAIGWILREYSKTNPEMVINFVEHNTLAPLSKREALKVINRN